MKKTFKRGLPMQIGEKYARLTVVEYLYTDSHPRKYFKCICECGGETVAHTNALRTGNKKSCGCLVRDLATARRVPNNYSEMTAIILGYKRHALGRGYAWDLSREEVESIVSQDCYYCGSKPQNVKAHKHTVKPLHYSGIDRVKNEEGYHYKNVVPCCAICNRAKQTMSVKEFADWAGRLLMRLEKWSKE